MEHFLQKPTYGQCNTKESPDDYEEMDVITGKFMDLTMLQYYTEIAENEVAMGMVKELQEKLLDVEVYGEEVGQKVNRVHR